VLVCPALIGVVHAALARTTADAAICPRNSRRGVE
jgi:hypothetical protein